ncbi:MAG TPA: M81 family metallopeptidase [Dongiaceae bacterium]|jgi:microcystin degradation protein MlrC|nr:M81 family metallopeptidase [Dongiaceae bacterium]
MADKKNLAVARFWYEGNSFSPLVANASAFHDYEWVEGAAVRRCYENTASELGGVIALEAQLPDWTVTYLHCCAAPPAGPIDDATFLEIVERICAGLERRRWDAVYLSLHGAAIAETEPLADLRLLEGVRGVIGTETPLGVTFDFHANLAHAMIERVDYAIGYKTYPHIDMAETAQKCLRLLLGGERMHRAFRKLPIILPSFNMRTGDGPMRDLFATARQEENRLGLADISLFGGFAYGDSPACGPSVLVTGPASEAEAVAETLANTFQDRRADFFLTLPSPEAALATARPGQRPIALLDPADNPLSGGTGDTTGLLRALVQRRDNPPAVFAFFFDPEQVAMLHEAGVGAERTLSLGGRLSPLYGTPLQISARVARLTDGVFRNRGPMWQGAETRLGRTALVEAGSLRIILTETCQTPNDPGYFALHGIDLAQPILLCVKAKNHFRAAFLPLCEAIIDVDCPGPAALDLSHLPYRFAKLDPSRRDR